MNLASPRAHPPVRGIACKGASSNHATGLNELAFASQARKIENENRSIIEA
jgi:hypothetical protein